MVRKVENDGLEPSAEGLKSTAVYLHIPRFFELKESGL